MPKSMNHSINVNTYLSIYPSIDLPIHLSIDLSIHLSIYQSIHPFIYTFFKKTLFMENWTKHLAVFATFFDVLWRGRHGRPTGGHQRDAAPVSAGPAMA
jgi:hypothetical protein